MTKWNDLSPSWVATHEVPKAEAKRFESSPPELLRSLQKIFDGKESPTIFKLKTIFGSESNYRWLQRTVGEDPNRSDKTECQRLLWSCQWQCAIKWPNRLTSNRRRSKPDFNPERNNEARCIFKTSNFLLKSVRIETHCYLGVIKEIFKNDNDNKIFFF